MFKKFYIQEAVKYQIKEGLPFTEPMMRTGSEIWGSYMREAREFYESGKYTTTDHYEKIILESMIGEEAEYQGKKVKLDHPTYAGNKKFQVFTKNKEGKVVKVEWGDPDLSVKLSDPAATKSFVARHKCSTKKDKTTPGWWACNLPAFAKILGIENPNDERYW